ncbi:hypothetical protein PHYPO_G00021350 [Pangasianodon hypophthalmus]|uniref:Uncharacterized protein n=1 Tax=Pangasianodon hypophthalmus TaxID=310915 RepID=A0A5N5MUZ5_PANHP|nr:hypothetical protein PHYPO_G00021350 [Pangasianodon hypophthalmus]
MISTKVDPARGTFSCPALSERRFLILASHFRFVNSGSFLLAAVFISHKPLRSHFLFLFGHIPPGRE